VDRTVEQEPLLIAAGRASEVFDLGDGRVLRRFKSGGDPHREAIVMRHARLQGFPVPEVLEIRADGLVLQKVEGPTMWEAATGQPPIVEAQAALLARLHADLHRIDAPDGLAAIGEGARLLHLDLHPLNVILSPSGPVVIDWTNARRGEPMFDVAVTWLIAATSTGLGEAGRSFAGYFLSHFERGELRRALGRAADYRLADENVTEDERKAIRSLVASEGV
jgi:aminoglycoside phosphotransferase (APT) family kinase protein